MEKQTQPSKEIEPATPEEIVYSTRKEFDAAIKSMEDQILDFEKKIDYALDVLNEKRIELARLKMAGVDYKRKKLSDSKKVSKKDNQ